jgi:hypothetical protein
MIDVSFEDASAAEVRGKLDDKLPTFLILKFVIVAAYFNLFYEGV